MRLNAPGAFLIAFAMIASAVLVVTSDALAPTFDRIVGAHLKIGRAATSRGMGDAVADLGRRR